MHMTLEQGPVFLQSYSFVFSSMAEQEGCRNIHKRIELLNALPLSKMEIAT